MNVTIWHNPACSTSCAVLARIEAHGIEPLVRFYLKDVPDVVTLADVIGRVGISVREAIRRKEAAYGELGLDDPRLSDAELLDAMVRAPVLIERPFVISDKGVRLCRPAEKVEEIL